MPTQKFITTMAGNEVVQNVLAGSQFEFVGVPTQIQIYAVTDPADGVDMEVFFGQELEMTPSRADVAPAAATGPIVPDNLLLDDIAMPGDRVTVRLTEALGLAATIIRTLVKFTPVG